MDGSTNANTPMQNRQGITLSSDNFSTGTCIRFKIAPHTWLYQLIDAKAKATGDYTIDTLPETVNGYGARASLVFPEQTGRVTGTLYVLGNSTSVVLRCLEANVWMVGQFIVCTL